MAQAQAQATAAYMEPINKLLEPTRISSLRGTIPSEGVKVYIIDNVLRLPKEPTLIKNIFPFSTIEDLKYEIWLQLGSEPEFLPQFQSLLTLRESFNAENPDAEYPQKGQDYYGADYLYFDTGASLKDPLILQSPLDVVSGNVDERFVDADGQLQPLKITKRERSTFEDVFMTESDRQLPVFHVFLLSGLRQVLPPATGTQITITEYDFNGRIAPYFPALSAESPLEPTETVIANSKKIAQVLRLRNRQLENTERILEEDVPGLKTPILSGITKLRLVWQENSKIKGRLDELFYKLDANEDRPFMRFLPVDGIPLTKLYSPPGLFSIPETIPIELIKQWAQEKSPISDADYVFIKILLFSGGFPLFGTLKIMEDGSADFVVVPPKNVRKLTPSVEFSRFSESLTGSLTGTGYETVPFSVQETSAVSFFSIDGPRINAQTIRKKLQSLSYFFQEIAPLPNEQPLISLRYKRVSNFANEDRVFSFLTQVISKKLVDGTETLAGLPKLLAEEFDISEKEAEQRIIAWNKSREQFTVGATTKKDIKQAINPGTDIYIYAQHPLYFCHIYRAENGVQLDRIYILLSMLLNVAEDELRVAGTGAAAAAIPEAHISPSGDLIKSVVATATAAAAFAPKSPEEMLPQATEEAGEDFGGYDYGMYEIPDNEDESAVGPDVDATELPPSDAPTKEDVLVASSEATRAAPQIQIPTETKATATATAPPPPDEGKIVVDSFFLNRLKQIDRELFNFKKTKGDKSITNYSVSCAANEDRQPLIMDELQYKRMRDIYDEDEDLVFIEYPLREKKNPVVPKDKEIAYVLKYGSDPGHQNYFICSEYFCVRDDIWLRKKEFENGTVDREGKPKKKATCPFCHGTVIKAKDSPNPGETVLKRKNKPKKDIPQLFISFLRKKKNPNGLSLPCCFVDIDVIRYEEEAFNHIREYAQKYMKVETAEGEDTSKAAAAAAPPLPDIQQEVPNYDILRNHLNSEYIVGPEKYPLEAGKVGLCPAPLDRYLGQVSQTLVSRDAIRQELKKNAMGFLRIGVQNSALQRDVSLFSALAPLLGIADTSQEVANFIKKSINPLLFQSFNFGNLVLEFYNPQDAPPTDTEFDLWIKRNVPRAGKIVKNTTKYDYLIRLYNSYKNFEAFIETPTRRKELRQFVHMLAEPGVLTERGITIIVLDYTGPPNATDTEIRVRCPLQAYAAANYTGNDIAFLTHDEKGIWEPIIFTNNVAAVGGQVARHEGAYVLQANEIMFRKLPDEIKMRIREFKEKCNSSGVAAYTSQIGVKPETLIPKYTLLYADEREQVPYGLVRDAYNHLVAATFVTNTKKVIAVPLADDGTLDNFPERKQVATGDEKKIEVRKVHFGWDDISPKDLPSTDEIIDFYKGEINVKYSLYKGYAIESIILYRDGRIAVKLRNGIPIPAGTLGQKYKGTVPEEESDTFPEWYIDNGIVMSKISTDKQKDELAETFIPKQRKQIEEVFQHLRFTFANYISRNRKIFKNIKAIVEPRRQEIGTAPPIPLELFERRKRLEILLGPLIQSWLAPQDPFNPEETLLRMDCSQITDAGRCTNFCSWRQGSATGTVGGACLIHTPTKIPVGSKKEVEAVRFFTLRLLEEILRIPEKRRQLFNKEVSYLSSPKATTRIGNQLIIPEINSQWYQILIEEKLPKGLERPRFFEEFSRTRIGELEGEAVAEPLSEAITEILGAEAAKNFQLWVAPNLYALMVPLNIRLLDFIEEGQEFQVIPEEILKKISFALKRTVVQLDLNVAAYFTGATVDKITDEVVVIVITETGEPAFLVDTRFPTKPLVARANLGDLQDNISEIRLRARARLVRPKIRPTAAT